ncbi:MAG: nicotinamide-nucleotide adenylyltransferase [Methanobacteriota archaeon]|nr:MAG: nicotinamide-nucleotide adenylyltransferase [Euryarchaeota archaeon]
MRALVVGRFQPLHKGHLKAMTEVLSECDELIVVIGSAEESHTTRNPLTAGERYQMLLSSLPAGEHSRVHIVPVRDVNRYSIWVNHIESYVPPFDIVYSNSSITRMLFSQVGYDVRKTTAFNSKLYSGAEIRRRIVNGEKWRHLVPKPVAIMLDEIEIRERLLNAERDAGIKRRPRGRSARK